MSANTRSNKSKKPNSSTDNMQEDKDLDWREILETVRRVETTVNDMAKQQSCMDNKLEALWKKMDSHEASIKDLERAADCFDQDIRSVREQNNELSKQIQEQTSQLQDFSSRIISLQDQIDDCQRYSRGFNLRFIGVTEEPDPTKENCIQKIQDLIKTRLNIQVDLENAHRIGQRTDRPRHIIAKFLRRPERFTVLRNRYSLQADNIKVFEDLIPKDLQARKSLYGVAQEARRNGKRTRFTKDYLIIDGMRYVPP